MFTNTLDPVLLDYSIFHIRWYGLLLVLGIVTVVMIWKKIFKSEGLPEEAPFDLALFLMIGGTIGARLGEVLFYEPAYYFSNPIKILYIHEGGLASHGMAIGLFLSFLFFVKRRKIDWKKWLDLAVIPMPILFAFIRLGNFFNSEILGRVTELPWAVSFPMREFPAPFRHPSQLYEMFFSLLLFVIMMVLYKKKAFEVGKLKYFGFFISFYFGSRFLLEFFKEYQTDFAITNFFTMGQLLSLPFILLGIWVFFKRK